MKERAHQSFLGGNLSRSVRYVTNSNRLSTALLFLWLLAPVSGFLIGGLTEKIASRGFLLGIVLYCGGVYLLLALIPISGLYRKTDSSDFEDEGTVAIEGKALTDSRPLKTPQSGSEALIYHYEAGHQSRRSYRKIAEETKSIPFYIEKQGSRIQLTDQGVDIRGREKEFDEGLSLKGTFDKSSVNIASENFIAPGDELFVIGQLDTGTNPPSLHRGDGTFYMVTNQPPHEFRKNLVIKASGYFLGGTLMSIAGFFLQYQAFGIF